MTSADSCPVTHRVATPRAVPNDDSAAARSLASDGAVALPGPRFVSGMERGALRVVHADAALIVVDKPAGLLCVPGRGAAGADCLARRVQALWPDALTVHRLDMATSGLVAFARGIEAQRRLGAAFAAREVDKPRSGHVEPVHDQRVGPQRLHAPRQAVGARGTAPRHA